MSPRKPTLFSESSFRPTKATFFIVTKFYKPEGNFYSNARHNATSTMNDYYSHTELPVCQQWYITLNFYVIMSCSKPSLIDYTYRPGT
jgi:hypothetical protein